MIKNIVISGVGGQGTLLASRVLGVIAVDMGCDVKVSEVHGMAQRGGSVITYVRYGDKISSPIISKGEADILIAFEQLEAARYLTLLKPGGKIIVNTQRINPMSVNSGAREYPGSLMEEIKKLNVDMIALDALSIANEAGSKKAINIVLLGVLAKNMDIEKASWIKAIEETVPQKTLETNKKAFEQGYMAV